MTRVFELLAEHGWRVLVKEDSALCLAKEIELRYKALPIEVRSFLGRIEVCTSPEEESWLLGAPDFKMPSELGFAWDGIEQLALEACDSADERAKQAEFWNNHFPIGISVRSDYDYLAICFAPDAFGAVVYGYAPEWENPRILYHSFSEFLAAFERALSEPSPPYPFSVFV